MSGVRMGVGRPLWVRDASRRAPHREEEEPGLQRELDQAVEVGHRRELEEGGEEDLRLLGLELPRLLPLQAPRRELALRHHKVDLLVSLLRY